MKIKQVEIGSNNLIETEKFYTEVLGFQLIAKDASSISFKTGSSTLKIVSTKINKPVYHFAFDIPHNNLKEAEKWLFSRVTIIQFQNENIVDFPNWNAKSIYFLDNNGNVLEFIARFNNENKSDMPFEGSSIVSISEIALVTGDVEELAKELIDKYGLHYYGKQAQLDTFSVLGEAEALLILVSSEKNWFPTMIKAERFPTKALLEFNNKQIQLEYNYPKKCC
ncbi:MAG: glyoxalase [Bacteroidota bacterium]